MEACDYDKNFGLNGKTALITGTSAGIGQAIAKLFYEKGARLVLVDLNPETEQIGHALGFDAARFTVIIGDVTQSSHRERTVATGLERLDRLIS